MPYKHIAAHLKKTELACRLHYHQLSHGTNRRKRAASFSSTTSSNHSPVSPEQRMSPEAEHSTAPTTPEQPSERDDAVGMWKHRLDMAEPPTATTTAADSPVVHKPILPKPVTSLPYPVPTPRHQGPTTAAAAAATATGLRLDCNVGAPPLRQAIDRDRLREAYEAHRVSFWKMIAADYGGGVDPALLEETWRSGSVQSPPTPDEAYESSRFGMLSEGRVTLPALQPSSYDRPLGRLHRRLSVSSAPSPVVRPLGRLPTPSTATTDASMMSASSVPATAIAALLNGSGWTDARDMRRSELPPRISEDSTMSDSDR